MIDDSLTSLPVARPGLGGPPAVPVRLAAIVIGSHAPRRLAVWYRQALGLPGEDLALGAGGVGLMIKHRPDVALRPIQPQRLIATFVVDDVLATEARLVALEVIWMRELEATPCGMIGTVLDADGNYMQVIESELMQPMSGAQQAAWP
jgi:hypothetical protein